MIFLSILICSALYAVKGGQHWRLRLAVESAAGISHDLDKQPIGPLSPLQSVVHRLMDGKVLSSIGFGLLVAFHGAEYHGFVNGGPEYSLALATGFLSSLGWLAGIAPKMGRIAGDIGGYKGNWGPDLTRYMKADAKRAAIEGWKAGLQRGVFMGAMLALATDNMWFIVAGATFPACVYIGISIQQKLTGKYSADWHWYEVLFGAVIGLAFLGA